MRSGMVALPKNDPYSDKLRAHIVRQVGYGSGMSFNDVLLELPALTLEQRQQVVRRALELDDAPLNPADESLIESRLTALRDAPASPSRSMK